MYESLTLEKKDNIPDDLGSMFCHLFNLVPWKSVIFIFLLYILLNTTVFVDHVLNHWPGTVDGRYPNEKGLMIQSILLSLGLIIFSIFVNADLI